MVCPPSTQQVWIDDPAFTGYYDPVRSTTSTTRIAGRTLHAFGQQSAPHKPDAAAPQNRNGRRTVDTPPATAVTAHQARRNASCIGDISANLDLPPTLSRTQRPPTKNEDVVRHERRRSALGDRTATTARARTASQPDHGAAHASPAVGGATDGASGPVLKAFPKRPRCPSGSASSIPGTPGSRPPS